jgi:Protein of unknown function (DUF1275)
VTVTEPTPSCPVRQTGRVPTEVSTKCRRGASGPVAGVASIGPVSIGAVVRYTPYTLRFALLLTVANSILDAHTYLVRGGVFAYLQTANVIFFAIHLCEGQLGDSLSTLWPIFAFLAGVALSSHITSPVESTKCCRIRSDGRWRSKRPFWPGSDSCPQCCRTVWAVGGIVRGRGGALGSSAGLDKVRGHGRGLPSSLELGHGRASTRDYPADEGVSLWLNRRGLTRPSTIGVLDSAKGPCDD